MDAPREQSHQGFISLREYVDVRFLAVENAVQKAEVATDKRFESVNEMRAMVNDSASKFMPRAEYEAAHSSIVEKVEALQKMLWVGFGVVLALQFLVSILLVVWRSQAK